LVHSVKVRAITEVKVETDKVDTQTSVHLLWANLLPRSYMPDPEIRRLRSLVAKRVYLTRAMTREKNRVRFQPHRRDSGLP